LSVRLHKHNFDRIYKTNDRQKKRLLIVAFFIFQLSMQTSYYLLVTEDRLFYNAKLLNLNDIHNIMNYIDFMKTVVLQCKVTKFE